MMASKRPIKAVYTHRNRTFKTGHAASLTGAIKAAVRTVVWDNGITVTILNPYGVEIAQVGRAVHSGVGITLRGRWRQWA